MPIINDQPGESCSERIRYFKRAICLITGDALCLDLATHYFVKTIAT